MRRALIVVAVTMLTGAVRAQAALTELGYSVDMSELPVLGSARAVGMGGAHASAGEGINAVGWNPAAAGTRASWEDDWFEWEVSFGFLAPTSARTTRFFGATSDDGVRTANLKYFDAGGRMQFGPAGAAVLARPRFFTSNGLVIRSITVHSDFAWSFLGGDLVAGVGVRYVNLDISPNMTSTKTLLGISGEGFEAGVTYAPHRMPFRASATLRSSITAGHIHGNPVSGYATPASVVAPWELVLSGTYGFGEAPLNAHPARPLRGRLRRRRERLAHRTVESIGEIAEVIPNGAEEEPVETVELEHRPTILEPARRRPRYGIVSFDLLIQGRVPNGVGLDGFITQTRRTWGSHVTASPRIGIEGEPWRDRLQLRGGAYLEADRSSVASPRVHFTHGFDLHLFSWDIFGLLDEPIGFQVTWTADFAERYASVGVGVGLWY